MLQTGGAVEDLVLITESSNSWIQYLDPLSGATVATGFALALDTDGVTLDGFWRPCPRRQKSPRNAIRVRLMTRVLTHFFGVLERFQE